jgi:twitching motility protein PilT
VYVPVSSKAVPRDEVDAIMKGAGIALPTSDGAQPALDVAVGSYWVRVRASRRGANVVVRIERSRAPRTKTPTRGQQPRTTTRDRAPAVGRTATRGKRNTTTPRTKGQTAAPRTRGESTPPRTKRTSGAPPVSKSRPLHLDLSDFELAAPAKPIESTRPTAKLGDKPLESSRPTAELADGSQPFELRETADVPPPAFELDLSLDDLVPPNAAPPPPPRKLTPTKLPGMELAAPASPARARPATMRDAGPVRFSELVAAARARGATDLHIATGRPAIARIGGEMVPLHPSPQPAVEDTLHALLDPEQKGRLAQAGYVDLAIEIGGARLRANISRFQGGLRGAFRLAAAAPSQLHELGLPKELAKVVSHHQGLVIVAGPSGHGKTTTLAALVDLINASKAHHIITVEDPIEIVYPRKMAVVSQREAGRHTKSFATALKASLREDPDVIVIGELRDRETVEIALTAAETGHLVLATMSTPSAAKTIDRLIDVFPAEEQQQVRASVAGALRAIVAQRLLPALGGGVVPAIELVTGVLPLAVLIRDDKLFQLPNLMQRGKAYGMIKLEDSIAELQRAGKIK